MLSKIKNYFHDWTTYDYVFLTTAFLSTLLCTIIFKSSVISFFSSFLGIATALLSSKAKWYAYVVGIIQLVFYCLASYFSTNYGELLLSVVIVFPMYVYTLTTWKRNNDDKHNVVVNKLNVKEVTIVLLSQVALFFAYYFILKAFNTPLVIVATFSILTRTLAVYFMSRRSPLGYLSYITNDIISIVVWSIPLANGDLSYLPIIINFVLSLVNDINAIFRWRRLSKRQNENIKSETKTINENI